jgi:hypothetical protein
MDRLPSTPALLVCFSHLRWNFVYQRPQHLMSRLAKHWPVIYVEEPVATEGPSCIEFHEGAPGLRVAVPRLAAERCAAGDAQGEAAVRRMLLQRLAADPATAGRATIAWCQTPMAVGHLDALQPALVVYDCMDELRNFRFAPPELLLREEQLIARAGLLFTGGRSLHEAKRKRFPQAHLFPSSVDRAHFAEARTQPPEPPDLAGIPHPRIGYYGVIDERIDLDLLAEAARLRPEWQWLMLGPLAKIDPGRLPQAPNLHYLGARSYAELPAYLGHWDAAMMPFALNDATRYISPTKTPEYLAGGCAVASTPVADVVSEWGGSGLVHIGAGPAAFVDAVAAALAQPARSAVLCERADRRLAGLSWDRTAGAMAALIAERLARPETDTATRRERMESPWMA